MDLKAPATTLKESLNNTAPFTEWNAQFIKVSNQLK